MYSRLLKLHAFRRAFCWLALLTLLAGALAPAVSRMLHALHNPTQGSWLEICTTQGVKRIQLDVKTDLAAAMPVGAGQSQSSTPNDHALHVDHCPFCAPHAGSLALLPPGDTVLRVDNGAAFSHPERFYHAPRTLFVWAQRQPRAPPFFLA